jgi:hypothetical protein
MPPLSFDFFDLCVFAFISLEVTLQFLRSNILNFLFSKDPGYIFCERDLTTADFMKFEVDRPTEAGGVFADCFDMFLFPP